MPAPRALARINRLFTNRLLSPLAARLPGFGIIVHTGRKSGRQYRTPVLIFRRGGGYVVALTYGPDSDWVRNVLASGGCTLETRGHHITLVSPRLDHDEQRRSMPALVRPILGWIDVSDFLTLDFAENELTTQG
jgi:deazaflavin-dependent oxidoreductase (nitroreductase family)